MKGQVGVVVPERGTILNLFLTILAYYTVGAIAFFLIFSIGETMLAQLKGPDFLAWVAENAHHMESVSVPWYRKAITWFLAWPLVLGVWTYYIFKGKTFVEVYLERKIQEKDHSQRTARRPNPPEIVNLGNPGDRLWIPLDMHDKLPGHVGYMLFMPHIGRPMMSHLIIQGPGGIVVIRQGVLCGDKLISHEPVFQSTDLMEAASWAETDFEWLKACAIKGSGLKME